MLTMRSLAIPLAALALGLTPACIVPGAIFAPTDLTVSSLLSGSAPGRLIDLSAGQSDVTVPLNGDRSSFLVFNSRRQSSDRLAVVIEPEQSAYRVAAVGERQEAWPFERRLRAWESTLPVAEQRQRYTVQQAPPPVAMGSEERFWVIGEVGGGQVHETQITAKARYVGQHCYVFVDAAVPDTRLNEQIAEIGRAFDEQIFPTNSRLFGSPLATGVNGDPRVTLLISPAVGNYGKDATIGYFTVRDLFPPELLPENPVLQRSNRRLMLYVSSNVVSRGQAADYLGTIAHEFEHLINASQKIFRNDGKKPTTEALWLDEGLAMYAMEANGYGLGGAGGVVFNHVAGYQANPAQYSLTEWGDNPEGIGYGAVYLFTAYLADRYGERMLKELVSSPHSGIPNLEAALRSRGTSFAQVFSDWTVANLLDDTGLTNDPRFRYSTLNLLGSYGGRKLRGMRLEPVTLPNRGSLRFRPHSAHYYYVPRGNGGAFRFSLSGEGGQEFSGMVVAP